MLRMSVVQYARVRFEHFLTYTIMQHLALQSALLCQANSYPLHPSRVTGTKTKWEGLKFLRIASCYNWEILCNRGQFHDIFIIKIDILLCHGRHGQISLLMAIPQFHVECDWIKNLLLSTGKHH